MGKIVILDENTANKIAAGEVIERPASVIKELVENSMDAGASSISVEIKNGGISFIKVTDNGSGIDEDDAEISFERHSTSKIRNADELDSIRTMGFRGEALASIAAVSNVELMTRVQKNQHGMYIRIQGGNIKEVKQTGCPIGTTFIIKELFYNTPARFKFLKKDSTETGYISDTISRIALGNPQISFRFINSNAPILHTPGNNDLLSTIYCIYGKDTAKEVNEINYNDGKLKITGYAGKPEIARATRNNQSIFINRRYIRSKIISSAIDEAYKTILMKNKFAFIVLNIEINPLLVDVNVHPTKMEVRFSEEQDIFRSVYHAVNNAFLGKDKMIFEEPQKSNDSFKINNFQTTKNEYSQSKLEVEKNLLIERPIKIKLNEINTEQIIMVHEVKNSNNNVHEAVNNKLEEINDIPPENFNDKIDENKDLFKNDLSNNYTRNINIAANANERSSKYATDKSSYTSDNILSNSRIIGQAFSTYILLQHADEIILLDQHAAHERILYELLKKKFEGNEPIAQLLLTPIVIIVTHQELKFLEDKKDFLNKLGYIYDNFGNNSVIIRAVPDISDGDSIKGVFMEVIDNLINTNKSDYSMITDETLYMIACKGAVKANKKLDDIEIKAILDGLNELENPYTCPHGRPTIIKMTKHELEKKFKRIV
jgi:DNA mismatch repair protein MutL